MGPRLKTSRKETDIQHLMELPRKILIGSGVISELGAFITSLDPAASNVAVISGSTVKQKVGTLCESSLHAATLTVAWHVVEDASIDTVDRLESEMRSAPLPDFLIGLGGGRSVDLAKMTAFRLKIPFLSVPTSASHDGISSPFVSIRGTDKPHSLKANTPVGVLADSQVLSQAPPRLLASGCGDLVAKTTAVKDWELGRDKLGEYFGTYAANLASMSAQIILDECELIRKRQTAGVRIVVEALISAGVASCIAGSSRPCSGAEHLFSHAIEYVGVRNAGLHGERVGIGAIMMAKLHGLDWEKIAETLRIVGAPTKARQIGLTEEQVVKALMTAPSLRPDRYTILDESKLTERSALALATSVKVI